MIQVVKCPSCAAPLEIDDDDFERCDFCGSRVIISPQNIILPNSFGFGEISAQAHKLKQVLYLARSGRKIEAIKIYRETFNTDLKSSKEAVEKMIEGNSVQSSKYEIFSTNLPSQEMKTSAAYFDKITKIKQEMRRGRKLNAVKMYHEAFRCSLKEAKEAIENLDLNNNFHIDLSNSYQSDNHSPKNLSQLIVWIIFLIVFLFIAVIYIVISILGRN